MKNSLLFIQSGLIAGLLISVSCFAETSALLVQLREPSSYVPDDDVITQPVNNELSFYERYVSSDKSAEVLNSRNQIKVWNENQTFADQYGLSTTLRGSAFFVPTPEEKFAYFKEKYMRYLKRKGEQPFKDLPKNWYQDYRASNEIDTIDEMELRFKNSNKTAGDETVLPESLRTKEISLWKGTQFIFQPRLDQGVLVVGLRGPLLTAKAWVGVNGQTEINFQKSVESIGFRVMFNYYAHSGKYFSSVDQRLAQNVYARVTSNKDPTTKLLDNTLMMLYAKQF